MPMHVSIAKRDTIEFIEQTQLSPLVTKGMAKVFYVGDNRNGTSITEEAALDMGSKLPGSPVVGYYRDDLEDFEEHSRKIEITSDKFQILDLTKPYGFVPTDSKIWFQTFIDDGVEHKYLCCEVILWTSAYPESQRVFDKGNNQSMELDQTSMKGFWTESNNNQGRIFIINEALIEKLCILGEDFEPCFEGASVQKEFALQLNTQIEQLRASLFSLMSEVEGALNEGGANMDIEAQTNLEEEKNLDPSVEEYKKQEEEKEEDKNDKEKSSDSDNNSEGKEEDKNSEDDKKTKHACKGEDDDKKKYVLEEIPEYVELNDKYSTLVEENERLNNEIKSLKEFKLKAERVEKQAKIDEFFMLSDEDKADVIENIDTYSLDDIEAKLCVICFRNKVSFADPSQDGEQNSDPAAPTSFSLQGLEDNDSAPEWVKAVRLMQVQE